MKYHQPVLAQEVEKLIDPQLGDIIIDGTLGNGGHTSRFLDKGSFVYGFDFDNDSLKITSDRLHSHPYFSQLKLINQNFTSISNYIETHHISPKAILLDLGLNINQLKSSVKGFSFNSDAPLDMRLNPQQTITAEEIINTYSYEELFDIFSKYSQEKLSKPIAIDIINHRQRHPVRTTLALSAIIEKTYQKHHLRTSVHPATKIFMALRMAVNQELPNLQIFLNSTLSLQDCRIVVITFHSTEDRLVKNFINTHLSYFQEIPFTQKPTNTEIKQNPLARSAILRSYKIK